MMDVYCNIDKLKPGQRLLICLPNSQTLADIIWYAYQRGIVVVPLDPRLPPEQRAFVTEHCQPSLAITEEGLQAIKQQQTDSLSDLRFIMYTSGSTGNPKGVMLSQSAVEHNARSVAKLHQFQHGHATCLPLYHCNALMMSLLGCHLAKSPLVIQPKFNAHEYFALIEKNNIRTASIVPALLHRLLEEKPQWPECLAYLISAAAPISQSLAQRFYDAYGPRLRQGYGLTEATNFSFVMPLLDDLLFQIHYVDQHPPVGLPLPDTQWRLCKGEVQVKGPNLMSGYWRNPKATNEAITADGWLRTGDLGEERDGYLVLKGRSKEIINRGGVTLYPVDIEQHWEALGLSQPFAAVSIADERLGEAVGLWLGHERTDEADLLLEKAAIKPAKIHVAPMITTSTGKPQRKKMAELLSQLG